MPPCCTAAAGSSGAKPGAKPTPQAPAKSAPKTRGKNAQSNVPPSPPATKKRKQKALVEDREEDSLTVDIQESQPPKPKSRKPTAAETKAAKAAKDKEIRKANLRLLAASRIQDPTEEGDASEDKAPPKKKSKTTIVLDEDEEEAARDLSKGIFEEEEGKGEYNEEEDVEPQSDEEGMDDIFEEEVISVSPTKKAYEKEPTPVPQDTDEEEADEFDTNGLEIVSAHLKPPSFSRSSRAGSRAPSPVPSFRGSGKVTRAAFMTEELKQLSDAAKSMVRMRILYGQWDTARDDKQWATDVLQTVVKEKPTLKNALHQAFKDEDDKENLLTYIMYGKGSLLNAFIGKARLLVVTNYSLTGKQDVIRERVGWLLTKTQFVYGDIDFKRMCVEKSKIWGNAMIKELLQVVIFGAGAKADIRSVQEIRKTQAIPISAVILSIVAIEHAIGEYRDGTYQQYPFKDYSVRKRYTFYEQNWNTLSKLSEKWATFYTQSVFNAISTSVGLNNVTGNFAGEDVEGITAMDLDSVVDENVTLF